MGKLKYLITAALTTFFVIAFEGFFRKMLAIFLSVIFGINSLSYDTNFFNPPEANAVSDPAGVTLNTQKDLNTKQRICLPFVGCTNVPDPGGVIGDTFNNAIQKEIQNALLEVVREDIPIEISTDNLYPTVSQLPGKPFQPLGNPLTPEDGLLGMLQKMLLVAPDGRLELIPGDYTTEVYLHCYKPNVPGVPTQQYRSPNGHRYLLANIEGKMADAIESLNVAALGTDTENSLINILVWNIQAGVKYEDMNPELQALVDEMIPEYRESLSQSYFEKVVGTWNRFSKLHSGLPSFENALDSLGDVGQTIKGTMVVRQNLLRYGLNYFALSEDFIIPETGEDIEKFSDVSWSKLNDRMFARLVTKNRTGETGTIQVRVLPKANDSIEDSKIFIEDVEGLNSISVIQVPESYENSLSKQVTTISPQYNTVILIDSSNLTKPESSNNFVGYKQLSKGALKVAVKAGVRVIPGVGHVLLIKDVIQILRLVAIPETHPRYYVQPSGIGFQNKRDRVDRKKIWENALPELAIFTKVDFDNLSKKMKLPTIVWGNDLPQTTDHIFKALTGSGYTIGNEKGDQGKSNHITPILHRLIKDKSERTGWYNKYQPCTKNDRNNINPTPLSLVCDEFPYHSTIEGNEDNYLEGNVSIKLVPYNEQCRFRTGCQGDRINEFYKEANISNIPKDPKSTFLTLATKKADKSYWIDDNGTIHEFTNY